MRRYFLRDAPDAPWREVTMTKFVLAERDAGFRPPQGGPGLATDGFYAYGKRGVIVHKRASPEQFDNDPELRNLIWPPPTGDAEFDSIISSLNWGDPA